MGTNYYLESDACPHCGRSGEPRHIGKSSAGWVFALHIYPDEGVNDLFDWKAMFLVDGVTIKNEYGEALKPSEMLHKIMCRLGDKHSYGNRSNMGEGAWFDGNYGLWRSPRGNTPGPWDYRQGDFS